jgi:hypothetical protein
MVRLIKRIDDHETVDRVQLESVLRKGAVEEDDVLAIAEIVESHFKMGSPHGDVLERAKQLDTSIPHEDTKKDKLKYPSFP